MVQDLAPTPASLHSIEDTDAGSIKSASKPDEAQHREDEQSDEPTEEEKKAERRLVRRLDMAILVWAWCAYVMKVSASETGREDERRSERAKTDPLVYSHSCSKSTRPTTRCVRTVV